LPCVHADQLPEGVWHNQFIARLVLGCLVALRQQCQEIVLIYSVNKSIATWNSQWTFELSVENSTLTLLLLLLNPNLVLMTIKSTSTRDSAKKAAERTHAVQVSYTIPVSGGARPSRQAGYSWSLWVQCRSDVIQYHLATWTCSLI